jgi:hypothetical protein
MWKCVPIFFLFALVSACDGETAPQENIDSTEDTTVAVSVPAFDISGEFEVLFLKAHNEISFENGMKVLTIKDPVEDDTLFFQYKSANECKECHVEFQIWKNDQYVEVIRDTGFGAEKMFIPASVFLNSSKFGTPDYERLSVYLSVRQFHPVETGNKRFLFYLDLK